MRDSPPENFTPRMDLFQWALSYPEAAATLRSITIPVGVAGQEGQSEGYVQSAVRLEAARRGQYLTRNNKGVLPDKRGVPVRFGLANSSKQESDTFASADLVGIYPLLITPAHVGCTVGQFYSVEVKRGKGGRIAQAQENWAALVTARGGRAVIINDVEMLP